VVQAGWILKACSKPLKEGSFEFRVGDGLIKRVQCNVDFASSGRRKPGNTLIELVGRTACQTHTKFWIVARFCYK